MPEPEQRLLRRIFLKMKIMALGAEAAIIRREERKWGGTSPQRYSLHWHRVIEMRKEARSACLAYGFLRSKRYAQSELSMYSAPDWGRIESVARRFADEDWRIVGQQFAAWKDGAEAYVKAEMPKAHEAAKLRGAAKRARAAEIEASKLKYKQWKEKKET